VPITKTSVKPNIAIMGKEIERSIKPTSALDPRRDSDIVVVRRAQIVVAAAISQCCRLAKVDPIGFWS
jgi:hypothetical protein